MSVWLGARVAGRIEWILGKAGINTGQREERGRRGWVGDAAPYLAGVASLRWPLDLVFPLFTLDKPPTFRTGPLPETIFDITQNHALSYSWWRVVQSSSLVACRLKSDSGLSLLNIHNFHRSIFRNITHPTPHLFAVLTDGMALARLAGLAGLALTAWLCCQVVSIWVGPTVAVPDIKSSG